MKLQINLDFEKQTIQFIGPSKVEYLIELIDKMPEIADFTIIPKVEVREVTLPNFNQFGGFPLEIPCVGGKTNIAPPNNPYKQGPTYFGQGLSTTLTAVSFSDGVNAQLEIAGK